MTESRKPYNIMRKKLGPDGKILGSELADEVAADKWRPLPKRVFSDDDDDRTCLFCSRPLAADQQVCEHCGSRAL